MTSLQYIYLSCLVASVFALAFAASGPTPPSGGCGPRESDGEVQSRLSSSVLLVLFIDGDTSRMQASWQRKCR